MVKVSFSYANYIFYYFRETNAASLIKGSKGFYLMTSYGSGLLNSIRLILLKLFSIRFSYHGNQKHIKLLRRDHGRRPQILSTRLPTLQAFLNHLQSTSLKSHLTSYNGGIK